MPLVRRLIAIICLCFSMWMWGVDVESVVLVEEVVGEACRFEEDFSVE